jgi:hypothetical protein
MKSFPTRSLIASIIAILVASSAMAAEKNDWTLSFPENKAHFVKVQMTWAKKDPYWKPAKAFFEDQFDAADVNHDGSLTEEEYKNRSDAKPEKKAAKTE